MKYMKTIKVRKKSKIGRGYENIRDCKNFVTLHCKKSGAGTGKYTEKKQANLPAGHIYFAVTCGFHAIISTEGNFTSHVGHPQKLK